ncbi:MAG: hypothetical protein HY207_09165 [Nitrospirae bacterium]|nr:hypothetical protein [Nitrospirota bacterium]
MFRITAICAVLAVGLAGCAFGGYARGDLYKTTPSFSSGTTKGQIVETLGPPDKYVKIDNTEYLVYRAKKGFFVLLYGRTEVNEYEIRLVDGTFQSARWLPAGSSFGIFSAQGAVAQ